MKDIMSMMKQAKQLQEKMGDVQAELEALHVEGVSGGGLVKVTLTGKGAMVRLQLDQSLLKPDESEILEDLIMAAHNDAKAEIRTGDGCKDEGFNGRLATSVGFQIILVELAHA